MGHFVGKRLTKTVILRYLCQPDKRHKSVRDGFCELYGYAAQKLIGTNSDCFGGEIYMGFSDRQRRLLLSGHVLIYPMYNEGDEFYKFIRVSAYEYKEFGGGAVFAVNPDKLTDEKDALFSLRIFEVRAEEVIGGIDVSDEQINYLANGKDINSISEIEEIPDANMPGLDYNEFKPGWELDCYCPL